MKQKELLRHLRRHSCFLKRQGKEHELWSNPLTGHIEAVPRHQGGGNRQSSGFHVARVVPAYRDLYKRAIAAAR